MLKQLKTITAAFLCLPLVVNADTFQCPNYQEAANNMKPRTVYPNQQKTTGFSQWWLGLGKSPKLPKVGKWEKIVVHFKHNGQLSMSCLISDKDTDPYITSSETHTNAEHCTAKGIKIYKGQSKDISNATSIKCE